MDVSVFLMYLVVFVITIMPTILSFRTKADNRWAILLLTIMVGPCVWIIYLAGRNNKQEQQNKQCIECPCCHKHIFIQDIKKDR